MSNGILINIENELKNKSKWEILGILILISAVKILLGGYSFGLGDLTPQLPRIYRILDSSYLINDFFLNASDGFGPRFYFLHFFSFLGRYFSIPIVFYVFYILSITIIAIVTFYTSKEIFNFPILSALVTTSFILTIDPFELGGGGALVFHYLKPAMLARPFAYIGLWAALKERPFISIILMCVSCLFQPLVGLETGFFAIIIMSGIAILRLHKNRDISFTKIFRPLSKIIIASIILLLWVLIFWITHYKTQINSEQFIKIWTFRAENSLIASNFSFKGYVGAIFFIILFFITWLSYLKKSNQKTIPIISIILILCIIIFCFIGFIFIEIIPTRFGINIWAFRMLFILKWVGGIVIIGTIINLAISKNGSSYFTKIKNKIKKEFKIPDYLILIFLLIIIVSVFTIINFLAAGLRGVREIILFVMCFFVCIWFVRINNLWIRNITPLIIIILINYFSFAQHQAPYFLSDKILPSVYFSSKLTKLKRYGANGIVNYVKKHTEKDAVFLTPPQFSEFRLSADRAIVVDLRAIPTTNDKFMKEWYQRLIDCYGDFSSLPPNIAKKQVVKNYKTISDNELKIVAEKYKAAYAVLYHDTKTSFPVEYSDEKFKLVKLII